MLDWFFCPGTSTRIFFSAAVAFSGASFDNSILLSCILFYFNKCNYFHGSSFMRLHSIFKLMHLDLPLVQVLLEGLPPNALNEDIERFLSGCKFAPSSIRTFVKLVYWFAFKLNCYRIAIIS